MARRGNRGAPPPDEAPLGAAIGRFLEWSRVRDYAPGTIAQRARYLGLFREYLELRGIQRPEEVSRAVVGNYERVVAQGRGPDGRLLSPHSRRLRLDAVRAFFRYLVRENRLAANPAADLELPRLPFRLPRDILTPAEAAAVLAVPDAKDPLGVRDRAILETFYSTGVRRAELAGLGVSDVDFGRGVVLVREGKGRRDRLVPIGEPALAWIDRYLAEVRPLLVVPPDDGRLFLLNSGEAFSLGRLSALARGYVARAEVGKRGACHLFRHSMATAMLEAGADLRFIQEMLGHADISTTSIYTHVAVAKLKAVHTATHPTARRAGASPGQHEAAPPAADPAGLLAILAREVGDDHGEAGEE